MSILWSPEPRFYRPRFLPSRCRAIEYRPPVWLWIAVATFWIVIALAAAIPHAFYNAHVPPDSRDKRSAIRLREIAVPDGNGAAETPARHAGGKE